MDTPMAQTGGVSKVDKLKVVLAADSVQAQFKNALAENANAFTASLIDLYAGDTYLQNCDPGQVVMQALKAAVLKLPINKALGFAFIVPFSQKGVQVPQFQLGYKGLIQLALRTNQYKILHSDVVYEGEYRTKNKLTGEFDLNGQAKSEKIIGYFAHFELTNGFAKTLYMSVEKVTAHAQKYSKSYNQQFSPWKTEFDAMAKKTVLRNLLSHWGVLSVEFADVVAGDDEISNTVQAEISEHGNKQHMDFQPAEEVRQDGQGTMDFANTNGGPGF